MKKIKLHLKRIVVMVLIALLLSVSAYTGFNIFGKQINVRYSNGVVSINLGSIERALASTTQYGWVNAIPHQTDDTHFEWINGAPYVYMNVTSGTTYEISNSPSTWTLNGITGSGKALTNTVYYANPLGDTTAPSATVVQAECYFLITNTSTGATDLTASMSDFSSGSDNSTNSNTGSNGATSFGAYCWYSGETYTNKGIMKSSGNTTGNLVSNLAASTNLYWGAEVKTQTTAWSGPSSATSTITITATAH